MISSLLCAKGWQETRIKGDLLIQKVSVSGPARRSRAVAEQGEAEESESETLDTIEELKRKGCDVQYIKRENFLDGHKIGQSMKKNTLNPAAADLLAHCGEERFRTILADPPWQFQNRTGKMAPEHKRLNRYGTMELDDILSLPVGAVADDPAHLYLWVPNALLPDGLRVMEAWGFQYKSNIVWHKIRKDGGPDGRGVGFYFRNVTELVLFGIRGKNARTLAPGRRQVNFLATQKREHSRKPDEIFNIIEACSPGPYLELFARGTRPKWSVWGDQADDDYRPTWDTYANHSQAEIITLEVQRRA
jgi:N6-adenosine-specific RNA methylase IME4